MTVLRPIFDRGHTSSDLRSLSTEPLKRDYGLTKRECEVVACVAYGMTTSDIALRLGISSGTARKHLENTYRKLGVTNRMSLMRFVQQFLLSK